MEFITNALVVLFGVLKGCLVHLTVQEWSCLMGAFCAALRALMIWRDNRAEQRKRTALLQRYSCSVRPTLFHPNPKARTLPPRKDNAGK